MITLLLIAEVKATEDLEKVQKALLNICPSAQIEVSSDPSGSTMIRGRAEGPEALTHLAKKFGEERILEAVRQVLIKSVKGNILSFALHRQAAFMGRIHLCDPDDISAMGPIRVEIHAQNISDVIDYISPPTIDGKPQIRRNLKLE